jgi:hypothetical protein
MLLPFTTYHGQGKADNLNFENVENNIPKLWTVIGKDPSSISVDTQEKMKGNILFWPRLQLLV